MATHPIQSLLALIKAALLADLTVNRITHIHVMADADLLPPEEEFPVIGLIPQGSEVSRGPGRDEVMLVEVVVWQELALPDEDSPSLLGHGLTTHTIEEAGAYELQADIRAVLDGAALSGYWQGMVIASNAPEVVPIDMVTDPDGRIESVRCWTVRVREMYQWTKYE